MLVLSLQESVSEGMDTRSRCQAGAETNPRASDSLMAVTPRSANARAVTYPVTMPARSLALGRERAAQLVLASVVLVAWVLGFGASSEGIAAAIAATAVAW